jgi:hypothetical protein
VAVEDGYGLIGHLFGDWRWRDSGSEDTSYRIAKRFSAHFCAATRAA